MKEKPMFQHLELNFKYIYKWNLYFAIHCQQSAHKWRQWLLLYSNGEMLLLQAEAENIQLSLKSVHLNFLQ